MTWRKENLFPTDLCYDCLQPFCRASLGLPSCSKGFEASPFLLSFFLPPPPRATQQERGEGRPPQDGGAGGGGALRGADPGAAAGRPGLPPALRLLPPHRGPLHLPLPGSRAGRDRETRGKSQFRVRMAVHSEQLFVLGEEPWNAPHTRGLLGSLRVLLKWNCRDGW